MDRDEKIESRKSISLVDIDQLCHLIDETTFGLKTSSSSSKSSSIPSYQIKAFHSSRLKRLHSSPSTTKSIINENENYSSLSNRFRSLSTMNLPASRGSSTNPFPSKSILPSMNEEEEEEMNSSNAHVHLQRTSTNSCNVAELAAYIDHFLYLPKSLSSAAELMYT